MGRTRDGITTIGLTGALLIALAGPAMAHGGEHDISRLAAGTVGGTAVTVWAADVPTVDGLSVTVGVDARSGTRSVNIAAVTPDGHRKIVAASPAGPGHWQAFVPVAEVGSTSIDVQVETAAAAGQVTFDYSVPTATWWMKLIIAGALAHGAACARWLFTRRRRAFNRIAPLRMAGATATDTGGQPL